jgi:acyl carrier protein
MNQREQIRRYFSENHYAGADIAHVRDDDSLLDRGLIDSAGILDVVAFIEDAFGVRVDDAEITPENFDSIDGMADFIDRKRQAKVA